MRTAENPPDAARFRRSAEHSSFQRFSFQHFSFTQIPLFPRNPLFPALRSGHRLFQRPSPGKQFPSIQFPSIEEVAAEVRRRLELFPQGGLFLGPTHAIQVGSPLGNVLALYRTAGSLNETIDDTILAVTEDAAETSGINLSKLF